MGSRIFRLTIASQYLGLIASAVIILSDLIKNGGPWVVAAVLMIILGIIYWYFPFQNTHLYFACELAIIAILLFLHPMAFILGFSFSAEVMYFLPDRRGAAWLGAMVLAGVIGLGIHYEWLEALLIATGVCVGYSSFGFMMYARRQAEQERQRSEALLVELREAHQQLEIYTAQAEALAAAEERNRLARELHDTLGHRLTVAAVQLEGAGRLVDRDPEKAVRMIKTVRNQVHEALSELRLTVARLRSPTETELPLLQAISKLAQEFETATGLPVELDISGEFAGYPDEHRLAIYRAIQEGLTNIQRHSQAGKVWLRLIKQEKEIHLEIYDNGIGPPPGNPEGFGLRGMRERVERLGGTMCLDRKAGGGSRLFVSIPVPGEIQNG